MPLDAALCAFITRGTAEVVGGIDADGHPFATRGWGTRLLDADTGLVRVLVPAPDGPRMVGRLSVTAADVTSLESVQFKGPIVAHVPDVEPADLDTHEAHVEEFFRECMITDRIPRPLLERFRPGRLFGIDVRIEELYDQTPGPAAGRPL